MFTQGQGISEVTLIHSIAANHIKQTSSSFLHSTINCFIETLNMALEKSYIVKLR